MPAVLVMERNDLEPGSIDCVLLFIALSQGDHILEPHGQYWVTYSQATYRLVSHWVVTHWFIQSRIETYNYPVCSACHKYRTQKDMVDKHLAFQPTG